MKKLVYFFSTLAIVLLIGQHSQAQLYGSGSGAELQLRYGIGLPAGGMKDQVTNNSFNGWDANLLFRVSEHVKVGFGVGYNDFYQKYDRGTYNFGDKNTNISAVVSNSIQMVPIMARGTYEFTKPEAAIQPYVSGGAGINVITYRQFLGEFTNMDHTSVKLGLNGEAGVNIPLNYNHRFGINIAADYNYAPFNYAGVGNLSYWGLKAGIYVPLH